MIVPSPRETASTRVPLHRQIILNGITTHYWEYQATSHAVETATDTPPFVFVHGFRGDHHGFEAITAKLPNFRIIVPDLPGFGESEPFTPTGTWRHNISGYAEWLRTFVSQLDLHSPPIIVGHSFGSIIVSAAVAQRMCTSGTILINPVAALVPSSIRGLATKLIVLYHWVASVSPHRVGVAFLRNRLITRIMSITMATTQQPELRSWIHEQHDKYFGAFANPSVVRQAFRALVDQDVAHFAALVPSRVLLITAEKDSFTSIEAQKRLAILFTDATLHVIPRVGHLIHYEAPTETAELISRFALAKPGHGGANTV